MASVRLCSITCLTATKSAEQLLICKVFLAAWVMV